MRILSGLLERDLELKETRVSRPQWLVNAGCRLLFRFWRTRSRAGGLGGSSLIKKSGSIDGDRESPVESL
jgi:hypothetical protein